MQVPTKPQTSAQERSEAKSARTAGTIRKPLVPWAAALLPLVGFLVLVDFAIWTDALRTFIPALGRDDAPLGLFVVVTSGLIGIVLLLGTIAYGETYLATLLTTSTIAPSLVAVAILLIYLSTDTANVLHGHALYLGTSAALALWAFSAPLMGWLASADTAQGRSYGELVMRAENLQRRIAAVPPTPPPDLAVSQADWTSACSQVRAYVDWLYDELGIGGDPRSGLRFALGSAYVNLWRSVHRAEELLLGLESFAEAIAGAAYDQLRLKGSSIPNADDLSKRLSSAVAQFGSDASVYFNSPPGTVTREGSNEAKRTGLAVLREVRHSINSWRDDRWEGLIRERNRLLRTIFLTSAATLVFILLGVVFHVGRGPFAAAAAFYLVGSTVGLLARLRAEGTADAAVDDYGLFEARLLHTPLLSGLAAVAGVYFFAVSPTILGTDEAARQAVSIALEDVFNLARNTRGLIAAAVFGLAPELLIGLLQKQADSIRSELSNSQAAGGEGRSAQDQTLQPPPPAAPADHGAAGDQPARPGEHTKAGESKPGEQPKPAQTRVDETKVDETKSGDHQAGQAEPTGH